VTTPDNYGLGLDINAEQTSPDLGLSGYGGQTYGAGLDLDSSHDVVDAGFDFDNMFSKFNKV